MSNVGNTKIFRSSLGRLAGRYTFWDEHSASIAVPLAPTFFPDDDRMAWIDQLTSDLAHSIPCDYGAGGPAATEPTAWAAVALALSLIHI